MRSCTHGVRQLAFARRGVSLVEILVATLIFAFALIPVVTLTQGSVRHMQDDKAAVAAGNLAGRVLNHLLYKADFDSTELAPDRNDEVNEPPSEANDFVSFRYFVEIKQVQGLTFSYEKVPYHPPCPGGTEARYQAPPTQAPPYVYANVPVDQLDRENAGRPSLKTIKLTIQWKRPGETFDDQRRVLLITRRARLEVR